MSEQDISGVPVGENNFPEAEKSGDDLSGYKDISDLFREHILSGKAFGSQSFKEEAIKIKNVPLLIKISAQEIPEGKEQSYLNFLKAFLESPYIGKDVEVDGKRVYGKFAKRVIIEGAQKDYDHLIVNGCSNALASGVCFRFLDEKGNFIRDNL